MKQCPFCGAQLQDQFMFCGKCGNAQPNSQQPVAPQQPVVPQQPAPAPKPPKPAKEPGKFHCLLDGLMRKYILPGAVGLLALQAIINLVDNIPVMSLAGLASKAGVGGSGAITAFIIISIIMNIGAAVLAFFSWKAWNKDKKMGPLFGVIMSGVSTVSNLIYFILMIVVRAKINGVIAQALNADYSVRSAVSQLGININASYLVRFPILALFMLLASIAVLVFTIMIMVRMKNKFHK